ncbi:TniQ family protein [Roseateles sp. DB2]|uniref:TniQ family protein n=1 Tax=Roseateles sp. DB2 TaxID=3453717 RepID=UPI003EEC980B
MKRIKHGVPQPFQTEAPSAWISRLVMAQRLDSVGELFNFIELSNKGDIDRLLVDKKMASLRHRCHLPKSSFDAHERLMQGVARCKVDPTKLMLMTASGKACFKFCPHCLADPNRQFMPIEWRFAQWCYCPAHHCLMMDSCPNCHAPIEHPVHVESSPAAQRGYAGLRRCLQCSELLCSDALIRDCSRGWDAIQGLERSIVDNGRALIAALHEGSFVVGGRSYTLDYLRVVVKWGLLPSALRYRGCIDDRIVGGAASRSSSAP